MKTKREISALTALSGVMSNIVDTVLAAGVLGTEDVVAILEKLIQKMRGSDGTGKNVEDNAGFDGSE